MGCGLRKLKPAQDGSPGKIYSTLKRPQVETKVGVAYTYRYLDFLIGKDDGTSTLRLSSVRELPAQLQELYQQGFVLAAVHPFIHPCGPGSNSPQHQLYRAVLVRLNDGPEKSQPPGAPYRLQLEECLSADQVPTPELIQGYVKKQIQDAADQGVTFVGFVQEPYGAPCTRIREPETPSLSLHSSPSSVLGSLGSRSPSSPRNEGEPRSLDIPSHEDQNPAPEAEDRPPVEAKDPAGKAGESGPEGDRDGASSLAISPSTEGDLGSNGGLIEEDSPMHNNNKTNTIEMKKRPSYLTRRGDGVELLALYNHPTVREGQVKYFTVKVPLRVQQRDEGVKGVEANWLDHMTQHFNNGASLVDGYFHLGNDNDLLPKSVESVFIFQEASESEPSSNAPMYDAIVVEQWTVIDGLQVKTDYVPLLQSLAMYGWRLTCVLPTPIIQSNSDGSLSTKQIVFLQRPVLARKRSEAKKLIFKTRSKSNKNSVKDAPKNKKKKNKTAEGEKDLEDPKIIDDGENAAKDDGKSKDERRPDTQMETMCKVGETTEEGERGIEEEVKLEEVKLEEVESRAEILEGAEKEDKGEENKTADQGKNKADPERKEKEEHLENGEGKNGQDKVSEPETKEIEERKLKEVELWKAM
ncbi:raftlin [Aplochiton taeniatus]